jgi:hypothetical protein
MGQEKPLPSMLQMNAFAGVEMAQGALGQRSLKWTLRNAPPTIRAFLRATRKADPGDWRDERVGWGLVLPHNPKLNDTELSTAIDAPEPIQELWQSRSFNGHPAPVLRYMPETGHIGFLRRDGADLPVSQSTFGIGEAGIPRYLLIYARPDQIPWQVQYSLNTTRCVGRLCLEGGQLENYVRALMSDWRDSAADPSATLVWAADHGAGDITALMRQAIAMPVSQKLRGDRAIGLGASYVDGSLPHGATGALLIDQLGSRKPVFIVTTSHGLTAPIDNPEEMGSQLGLLIDNEFTAIRPAKLLKDWRPGGAIWYAHACCSAGSDERTLFDGLLEPSSQANIVLQGVAKCGARVAPLPQALLGAADPLRAFIGHVEPTFNWTLEQPETKQYTTDPLVVALYDELFQPMPIGLAMSHVYGQLGGLYVDYETFLRVPSHSQMLYRLLVARDIQSTVILGDPTVTLPIL